MKRFVMQIEYDGSNYAGFQLQPSDPTVQGALEQALEHIYHCPVRIFGSGRTDAGVHAHYQIVHFDPPRDLAKFNLKAALNSLLRPDIRVIHYALAEKDFHARFSAKERVYKYRIHTCDTAINRLYSWQIRQSLALKDLQTCADFLHGDHDFTSFCSAKAVVSHKRCIITHCSWEKLDQELIFNISANRFLHSMVRSLVGTMVNVGKGYLSPEDFNNIFKAENRLAGALTAPPQGLSLMHVNYEQPIAWEE